MSEVLDRLERRLREAGWEVRQREEALDGEWVRAVRWLLGSRRVPLGAEVELRLRVFERASNYYFWGEESLVAAAVRHPLADAAAQPPVEANFTGEEVERENYRQLLRVLEWFRDPVGGDFWAEPARPGDWEPPASWSHGEVAGARLGADWSAHADAGQMLRYLPARPSDRKLRLIACACCRLLALPMMHERNRAAVAAVERYAEEGGPRREVKKLCRHSDLPWLDQLEPLELALHAARLVAQERPGAAARAAGVVREIMGDPFRPVPLRRQWLRNLGGVVAHLAESIAAERRYEDMPVLADALEDAGCSAASILGHCRGPGPHVRGCWVLDLLRGRG